MRTMVLFVQGVVVAAVLAAVPVYYLLVMVQP